MEILINFVGIARTIGMALDSIVFGLVDNAYNLINDLARNPLFDTDTIKTIMKNLYVVMGLFAFFRVAIILVNAIINPDKLTEKGNGIANVGINILIMFAMLIAVPTVFEKAYEIQKLIVDNHVVDKLFLNTETLEKSNPGRAMQSIAIGALVTWNDNITSCSGKCQEAKTAYENMAAGKTMTGEDDPENGGFKMSSLAKYASVQGSVNGEKDFVYVYKGLLTFAVGFFLTYVLFSFAIDIGVRTVELAVLQIVAPLFIATYVDPKSAKSGPFKNWVTTTLKTYASLFIKLAIISLTLLLISLIPKVDFSEWHEKSIGKLTILISVLIFAKKAPDWIGKLIGIEAGLGGLGIGKKLGSAALIGGAVSKGLEGAKKFGTQKAKNFGANKIRNTAARLGAAKEELSRRNAEAKKDGISRKEARAKAIKNGNSLWNVGQAAASKSRVDNWGKDAQGLFKDLSAGYMGGRLNVDPNAKTLSQKFKGKAEEKSKTLNDEFEAAKKKENYDKYKEAKKMYKNVEATADNQRMKVKGPKGMEVFVNPRGTKEMNEAFGNPVTTHAAFDQLGKNLVNANGNLNFGASGEVIDSNGKVVANSAVEYAIQNTTRSGRLAIKSLVAENVSKDVSGYQQALEKRDEISSSYTREISSYNEARTRLASDPANDKYREALLTVGTYNSAVQKQADANKTIQEILSKGDYKSLISRDESSLNTSEKATLDLFKEKIAKAQSDASDAEIIIKKKASDVVSCTNVISEVEKNAGISEMRENIERAKTQLDSWKTTIKEYEDKFNNTMVPDIDIETGKLGASKNPYIVKINGTDYKVGDPNSLVKFEEIKNILNSNASKAQEDFKNSMKSETEEK